MALVDMPYHRWAPALYSNLQYSLSERLFSLLGLHHESRGPKIGPLVQCFARSRVLRTKLRMGMAPVSRERWLERKMDDPQNYRNLQELMADIFNIFAWLNHDTILDQMRYSFNWMVDQYVEFEGAVNLLRQEKGVQERLNLAGMWAEYHHSLMSTMSNRTHQWLVARVDEVQARAFAEYNQALEKCGTDEEAIATAGKKYYECVQRLNFMIQTADWLLNVPMIGFKGHVPSGTAEDLSFLVRRDAYYKIALTKSWKHQKSMIYAHLEDEQVTPSKEMTIQDYVDEMKNGL
jgi:hypothetical protein